LNRSQVVLILIEKIFHGKRRKRKIIEKLDNKDIEDVFNFKEHTQSSSGMIIVFFLKSI
jgi:hypothetical protein